MLAKIQSSAVLGIDAFLVEVEVDIAQGLPSFTTVGLPEASVKESKERVKAAIRNSGYAYPDDRITINLAPANIRKEGTGFDLPIAIGILAATGLVPQETVSRYLLLGELSLDGRVKPVKGALPMALAARAHGYENVLLSEASSREAAIVEGVQVYPVKTLGQVVDVLRGLSRVEPERVDVGAFFDRQCRFAVDFSEVVGQEHAKRALEIAAAGGHNLMMIGPPGSGKTMLAKRLPTILPPLSLAEAMETTKIYSVVGRLPKGRPLLTQRPFRAPHHTISDAGLIGGGHIPRPGEVSLSHNGVLFLDELAEFKKPVLEMLRQPLEDQLVTISRATTAITYPSSFMLVAAMNPCPCGFLSDPKHPCRCSEHQIHKYRARISGPLLDRIDLHVEVPAVPYRELRGEVQGEDSDAIRRRVVRARAVQERRFRGAATFCNAQMGSRQIKTFCRIDEDSLILLEAAVEKLGLSARAYNRVLKIARTIADLAGEESIQAPHVAEAVQYRSLDRGRIAA